MTTILAVIPPERGIALTQSRFIRSLARTENHHQMRTIALRNVENPNGSGLQSAKVIQGAKATKAWPYPLWLAHRGAGKLAPENTLAAFRLGAAHGYRAFECDVKLSADGVPFLLHDATLDRTTPASGLAGDRPWAELSQLDAGSWHSRQYAGEALPTLEAIARYVQSNGFALNIEIKPSPGMEQATGEAVGRACVRLWAAAGAGASPVQSPLQSPVPAAQSPVQSPPFSLLSAPHLAPLLPPLFSSFQPEALTGAQSTAPAIPRALLLDTLWDGWLPVALRLGCVAVVTNHQIMDSALMATLQSQGLQGLCYTVNEAADAQRLLALGVMGLITDAVDRFVP